MIKDDTARFKHELSDIRKIQASLLPDFKSVTGYDINSAYLPANDISGDFFDGFFISEDVFQIIICDVSGHGMASAYIGNEIRTIFRIHSSENNPIETTARLMNSILVKELKEMYYYCTAIICRINIKTGAINYLNAGHPPAVMYNTDTGLASAVESSSPLIGLFADNEFRSINLTLKSNDYLLLYTDGISEAIEFDKITEKGMFGIKRIIESVVENVGSSSKEMLLMLMSRVYEFMEYTEQMDDITAICIRKKDNFS